MVNKTTVIRERYWFRWDLGRPQVIESPILVIMLYYCSSFKYLQSGSLFTVSSACSINGRYMEDIWKINGRYLLILKHAWSVEIPSSGSNSFHGAFLGSPKGPHRVPSSAMTLMALIPLTSKASSNPITHWGWPSLTPTMFSRWMYPRCAVWPSGTTKDSPETNEPSIVLTKDTHTELN